MVNPGSFRGSRHEFLTSEKAAYAAGVDGGYAADALAIIQRRYFKRYPVDLPHNVEPLPEFLAAVDDTAAEPEQPPPDDTLSPEEYAREVKLRQDRGKLIDFRKSQIKRWLTYQFMKDRDTDSKNSGADDPYSVLLGQLTGISSKKPRSKLPVNLWRKTQREEIEVEVRRRIHQAATDEGRLNLGSEHKKMAGVREKVVREWFSALSQEEKDEWAERAKEDYEHTLVEWKNHKENGPSSSPAAQQRCIENLVRFVQPILDGICKTTGWKASLIAGGPEPAHGGRLNIISIHSGTTSGDVKVNFGRSERVRYKRYFVPMYADFLRKCYTPEQCRACALPEDEFEGLYTMGLEEDDVNFDSVGIPGINSLDSSNGRRSNPRPIEPAVSRLPDGTDTSEETLVGSVESTSANVTLPPPSSPRSQLVSVDANVQVIPSTTIANANANGSSDLQLSKNAGVDAAPPPVAEQPPNAPQRAEPTESQMAALLDIFANDPSSRSSSTDPWDIPVPHPLSRPQSVVLSANPSPRATPSPSPLNSSKRPSSPMPGDKQSVKRPRVNRADRVVKSKATRGMSLQAAKAKAKAGKVKRTRPSAIPTPNPSLSLPSATSNTSDALVVPEDSPLWFKSAITMFSTPVLGDEWNSLIAKWHAFETGSKFEESSNLKAAGRPDAVGMWIGRRRATTWQPKLVGAKSVKAYGTSHIAWWQSLVDSTDGDWEQLRKSGINGLLSVVASLFFWGINVKRSSPEGIRWSSAVNDLISCLSHLV